MHDLLIMGGVGDQGTGSSPHDSISHWIIVSFDFCVVQAYWSNAQPSLKSSWLSLLISHLNCDNWTISKGVRLASFWAIYHIPIPWGHKSASCARCRLLIREGYWGGVGGKYKKQNARDLSRVYMAIKRHPTPPWWKENTYWHQQKYLED